MDMKTNSSERIHSGKSSPQAALVRCVEQWTQPYELRPKGSFGALAIVRAGEAVIRSDMLDLEFTVPFDDDMEANEAEIIIYNLSSATINQIKRGKSLSISAGYEKDLGLLFSGKLSQIKTKYQGADKVTSIKCTDGIRSPGLSGLSFAAGSKASYILKALIDKTGMPVAVFKIRRDHRYSDAQTVDGDLTQAISKYAKVCGISVYVNKGKIYARHLKEGDMLSFTLSESTGLIGTPEEFEEEETAEDFKELVRGYKLSMLLQHRISAGAIVGIKSRQVNGSFRVRAGEHIFNEAECLTNIEVI